MTALPSVHRIVLTGGPCGGKTTSMAAITEHLEARGVRVYRVPEVATMLFSGGASLADVSLDQLMAFENELLDLQLRLEESFTAIARSTNQPSVVLVDRGTMDIKAYLPPAAWDALMEEYGTTEVRLRDGRYDAVLHLVTAAIGAREFYTNDNNATRLEGPDLAAELDCKVRDAWVGHPELRVFDNSTDFDAKVKRVMDAICRTVGVDAPAEHERRFLLPSVPASVPYHHQSFELEQSYLVDPEGHEARVRRRTQRGSSTFTHTLKRRVDGEVAKVSRQLSGREYLTLSAESDPDRTPIQKTRHCFLWNDHSFRLDIFHGAHEGLAILEVGTEHRDGPIELPPFAAGATEVTGDTAYMNRTLARSQA